ncbi:hypothetical protein PIROE2DRAFT_3667, partial [Piromyces sp. E2]
LFHVEYLEFKELFKVSTTGNEETSNTVVTNGANPYTMKNKKFLQKYETIYIKANDLFTKFFTENSELQLNLPSKIVKTVNTNYYNFHIYYNRHIVNGDGECEIDMEKLDCENLFDQAHDEAYDSLFLNVYSSFAKDKKKFIEDTNNNKGNRNSATISLFEMH